MNQVAKNAAQTPKPNAKPAARAGCCCAGSSKPEQDKEDANPAQKNDAGQS